MTPKPIEVRPAEDYDRRPLALLFAAVAEERDGIAAEPPVDVEKRAASFNVDHMLVALTGASRLGTSSSSKAASGSVRSGRWSREIGVVAAPDGARRRCGEWARAHGLHKLTLGVFPQNEAAIALYRKCGFVEEGRRVKHLRRANGELWDLIEMGLLL